MFPSKKTYGSVSRAKLKKYEDVRKQVTGGERVSQVNFNSPGQQDGMLGYYLWRGNLTQEEMESFTNEYSGENSLEVWTTEVMNAGPELWQHLMKKFGVGNSIPLLEKCIRDEGALDLFKMIAEGKGVQVNNKNESKQTFLHLAALHGREDICEYLIEKFAYVNILDGHDKTPMDLATKPEVIGLLFSQGADPARAFNRSWEIDDYKVLDLLDDLTKKIVKEYDESITAITSQPLRETSLGELEHFISQIRLDQAVEILSFAVQKIDDLKQDQFLSSLIKIGEDPNEFAKKKLQTRRLLLVAKTLLDCPIVFTRCSTLEVKNDKLMPYIRKYFKLRQSGEKATTSWKHHREWELLNQPYRMQPDRTLLSAIVDNEIHRLIDHKRVNKMIKSRLQQDVALPFARNYFSFKTIDDMDEMERGKPAPKPKRASFASYLALICCGRATAFVANVLLLSFFVSILTAVVYEKAGKNVDLESLIVNQMKDSFLGANVDSITNEDSFWKWMTNDFVDGVKDFNIDSPVYEILSPVQLRQFRVSYTDSSCYPPELDMTNTTADSNSTIGSNTTSTNSTTNSNSTSNTNTTSSPSTEAILAHELFQHCFTRWSSSHNLKDSYGGPNQTFDYTNPSGDKHLNGGFAVSIPVYNLTLDPSLITDAVNKTFENNYTDGQTSILILDVIVSTTTTSYFAIVRITIEAITPVLWSANTDVKVVDLDIYRTQPRFKILSAIFVLAAVLFTIGELIQVLFELIAVAKKDTAASGIRAIIRQLVRRTLKLWNFVDLLMIVLSAFVIAYSGLIQQERADLRSTILESPTEDVYLSDTTIDRLNNIVSYEYGQENTAALLIIVSWFGLYRYFSIIPVIGVLFRVFMKMIADFAVFATLYLVFAISFALSLHLLIGNQVGDYSSWSLSILALIMATTGNPDFTSVQNANVELANAIFLFWLALSPILLINLLIAIFNKSYEEIIQQARDEYRQELYSLMLSFGIETPWSYTGKSKTVINEDMELVRMENAKERSDLKRKLTYLPPPMFKINGDDIEDLSMLVRSKEEEINNRKMEQMRKKEEDAKLDFGSKKILQVLNDLFKENDSKVDALKEEMTQMRSEVQNELERIRRNMLTDESELLYSSKIK